MPLMERVSALIRANLKELMAQAEDPDKTLSQVIVDMENQLMQVKTQVAIAMADEHLLLTREREKKEKAAAWMRKAELALDKGNEDLAREALERADSYGQMAGSYSQQVGDQAAQVELLKSSLRKLQQKLDEARTTAELMMSRRRRSRAVGRAVEAGAVSAEDARAARGSSRRRRAMDDEAVEAAHAALTAESTDDRFAASERGERIDELLAELKKARGHGSRKRT